MLCNSKFFDFVFWFGGVVMTVFGVHTLFFLELPEGRHIAPFLATSIANICGGIPLIYLITSSIPKGNVWSYTRRCTFCITLWCQQ